MTSVIVSSLDGIEKAMERYSPGFVISILDRGDAPPAAVAALPQERRLELNGSAADEACWTPDIITFAKKWSATDENILIHCHRGVARSTAIAYILICLRECDACEEKIAQRLRAAAPHADPNLRLVSEADRLLAREDRMVGAVLDLCPCSSTVTAPLVVLPVDK